MRPGLSSSFTLLVAALLPLAACAGDRTITGPLVPDPVPNLGTQSLSLTGGPSGAEYMLVVANTALNGTTSTGYSLRGAGLAPSASVGDPGAASMLPSSSTSASGSDLTIESRIRSMERRELTGRIAGARAWYKKREAVRAATQQAPTGRSAQSIPDGAKVGDIVRINVQADSACSVPVYHPARIAAIGVRAMILEDTLNPRNGFSDADYRRYAARFDTLVYPLDSAAFGAPTDIDHNGHIALVFTRAVNELTPRNSISSYYAGFTFSRDLFPIAGGARTVPCAGSNEGEYFYLLAPDPQGSINSNQRSTAFVDSITTSVIAHELQHLINVGRRLYVNDAPAFEEKWLDEGLAHIAEELLFYRETGLTPRVDIGADALQRSTRALYGYNRDMVGNEGRYRSYLLAPSRSSAFAPNDDLATRGAAWSLLRYLVDRSPSEGDVLHRLANSRSTGLTNLIEVFGTGIATSVRDWNVSHAADDVDPSSAFQQPSWNWHSIYPSLGGGSQYPLQIQSMTSGVTYTGSVLSGGAGYFRMSIPANSTVSISLTEEASASSNLSLVTIRTK